MNHRVRFFLSGLALLAAATSAPAEDLGRLFHSPQERAAFDAARTAALAPAREIAEEAAGLNAEPPTRPAAPLTVEGIVTRSSGANTVWLNGEPLEDTPRAPDGTPLRITPGAVEIPAADGHPAQALKPGQTWDPLSGQVIEAHEPVPRTP